jgi:hypothetical protein
MSSFKPEVIADNSGKWVGNQCRFASFDEANAYARDLMGRWTLVIDTRVVKCDDPVNYRWDKDLGAVFLEGQTQEGRHDHPSNIVDR